MDTKVSIPTLEARAEFLEALCNLLAEHDATICGAEGDDDGPVWLIFPGGDQIKTAGDLDDTEAGRLADYLRR